MNMLTFVWCLALLGLSNAVPHGREGLGNGPNPNAIWSEWEGRATCTQQEICDAATLTRTRECLNKNSMKPFGTPPPPPANHPHADDELADLGVSNAHQCQGLEGGPEEQINCADQGSCSEIDITCENKRVNIICPEGKEVKIITSNYGRTAPGDEVCDHWSIRTTECYRDVTDRVQQECQDNVCNFKITNRWAGKDPCVNTYKYIETEYQCVDPTPEENED